MLFWDRLPQREQDINPGGTTISFRLLQAWEPCLVSILGLLQGSNLESRRQSCKGGTGDRVKGKNQPSP